MQCTLGFKSYHQYITDSSIQLFYRMYLPPPMLPAINPPQRRCPCCRRHCLCCRRCRRCHAPMLPMPMPMLSSMPDASVLSIEPPGAYINIYSLSDGHPLAGIWGHPLGEAIFFYHFTHYYVVMRRGLITSTDLGRGCNKWHLLSALNPAHC